MNQPVISRPEGKAQTTRLHEPESPPVVKPTKVTLHDDKPPVTLRAVSSPSTSHQVPTTRDPACTVHLDLRQPAKQTTGAAVLDLSQPRFTWSLASSPITKGPRGEKAATNHASMKPMLATVKGFKDRSEQ
jgi:hypothetical protein